jgi:hypothetical protein
LPISCGDSSEHEGPDSSKPIRFYFINHFRLIDDSIFLFICPASSPTPTQPKEGENPSLEQPEQQQQSTEPLQTSRSDSSLNGTFEMISESEVRKSAIQQQQQQQTPKANVVAPFVSQQPGKKFRHVLKEGFDYLIP